MEAFKTPKLQQPSSPHEARLQLSHSSALSPFARQQPRTAQPALGGSSLALRADQGDNARAARIHRLRSPGALPTELHAALRQRDLEPEFRREPCSFDVGAAGVAWVALGGALYVWKTDSPHACMRLTSGLAGETADASLVCVVSPSPVKPPLLLVCWRSGLSLYPLAHLLQSHELLLAAPTPLATCALPSGATAQPRTLQSVAPPTGAPAGSVASACALFAASNAQGYGVCVALNQGAPSMSLVPLARGGGALQSLLSGVMGLLSQSSRAAAAPITCLAHSLSDDGGVILCLSGGAGGETLEVFRRQGGPAGAWAQTAEHALRPLLAPHFEQMGHRAAATPRIVDLRAAPAPDGGVAAWLLVAAQPGGADSCDLSAHCVLLAAADEAPPALQPQREGDCLRAALPAGRPASALDGVRLTAATSVDGPLVLFSPAQAWALRDAAGQPARTLLLAGAAAAAPAEAPLLGALGDQCVLGGGGDEYGVLLLLSQRLVRLGYAPPARAGGGARGHGPRTSDDELGAELMQAWREGVTRGAGLLSSPQPLPELLAVARDEAAEQMARVVVGAAERLVGEAPPGGWAELERLLQQKLAAHAAFVSFCVAHHGMLAPARQPQRFTDLVKAGEKAAAALALCRLRNASSADNSQLLLAALEGAVRARADPGAAADEPHEAFYAALLDAPSGAEADAAFEALLAQLCARAATTSAAAASRAERLGALGALCDAAVLPLRAAVDYREEQLRASTGDGCGGGAGSAAAAEAAEAAAQRAGLLPWTAAAAVLEPLLRLAEAVGQAALRTAAHDCAAPTEEDGAAGALLLDAVAAVHEARLRGLATRLAVARASARDAQAARAELEGARQAAAAQLRQLGALPQLLRLAEAYCDFRTLAHLCTKPAPEGGGGLPPLEALQEALLLRFEDPAGGSGGAAAALAREEAEANGSFAAELLQGFYEMGPLGCRQMLRLPERYPYLAPALRAFLQKHPGLHWMQLVDEDEFDGAARALYSWALQGEAFAMSVAERKAVLSLGKLSHLAAALPDDGPPPRELPPVARVAVPIDGRAAEDRRGEVRFADASDEQYCLRVQERLPWLQLPGGAACSTEAAVEQLLAHAALASPPPERGVNRQGALTLALELVHKTEWRHTPARQRARLQAVLRGALCCGDELERWRRLAADDAGLNDAQRRARLEGAADVPGLALFALLKHQEEKAAAEAERSAVFRAGRLVDEPGGMLAGVLADAGCKGDAKLRASLLRAQKVAEWDAAATVGADPLDAWVQVAHADAMQE